MSWPEPHRPQPPAAPVPEEILHAGGQALLERIRRIRDAAHQVGIQAVTLGLCGAPVVLADHRPGGGCTIETVAACMLEPHPAGTEHHVRYEGEDFRWHTPVLPGGGWDAGVVDLP